jgi:hypothetical protein
MHRGNRYVASLFLSATLLAPIGAFAAPAPQDDHERHEEQARRVYDAEHKVYHNWDDHEDVAYRRWFEERHVTYVEYEKLKDKDQRAYWKWRHDHPDQR